MSASIGARISSDPDPKVVRRLQRVYVGLTGLSDLVAGLIVPIRVLNLEAREVPVVTVSILIAGYAVFSGLLEFPTGGLADAWGRRRCLLLAGGIAVAGFALLGLSPHVAGLAGGLALIAFSNALASGPLDAWFVDACDQLGAPEQIGALSAANAASNVGFAVGAGLAAVIPLLFSTLPSTGHAVVINLTPIYLVGVALHLGRLYAIWTRMKETRPKTAGREPLARATVATLRRTIQVTRQSPPLRRVLGTVVASGIVVGMFEVLAPLSLTNDSRVTRPVTVFALVSVVAFVGAAVNALAAGRVEALFETTRMALAGVTAAVAIATAACLVLPRSMGVMAALVAMWVVGGPLAPILHTELHRHVESTERASAVSALSLSLTAGAAVGSIAVGVLKDVLTTRGLLLVGLATLAWTALWVAIGGELDDPTGLETYVEDA